MDVKQLVQMANRTHEACGWSGPANFELDPESQDKGSLIACFEIHKAKLDDAHDQLTVLQEIKSQVYAIWGNYQKGIEFWRWSDVDSGMILAVWLDRGTPEE